MDKIIIFGIGSFAKLMKYYFETDTNYIIEAFIVDDEYYVDDNFEGKKVIKFSELEENYSKDSFKVFTAIGYKTMRKRKIVYRKLKEKNYNMVNYISSKAKISENSEIGENNIIMSGATIEPYVKIKNNNIFWTDVLICHDTKIKSHNFFAAKTTIGGFCNIKSSSFFGFNSTVINNINIKKETLVGAKSLILKNTKKYSKYIGIPAKKITNHKETGIEIK